MMTKQVRCSGQIPGEIESDEDRLIRWALLVLVRVLADRRCRICRCLRLVQSPHRGAHLGVSRQIFGNDYRINFAERLQLRVGLKRITAKQSQLITSSAIAKTAGGIAIRGFSCMLGHWPIVLNDSLRINIKLAAHNLKKHDRPEQF